MITFKNGDLFAVEADALAHGVNTVGVMGGIAGAFAQKFPLVSSIYREMCEMLLLVPGDYYNGYEEGKVILHVVSQDEPGPDAKYDWLYLGLMGALHDLIINFHREEDQKIVVAMPLIGCGIGGLEFDQFYSAASRANASYNEFIDIVVVYNDQNKHLIPEEVLEIHERFHALMQEEDA